jgi:hypothetical protein
MRTRPAASTRNSFTSCEQVSDGETWQEILAAHLGEPIRNFGTGAYSVYLAYLRMQREEKRWPAKYIIFNIYDDDHYRNLLPWQRPRFGVNRKSIGPTLPPATRGLHMGETSGTLRRPLACQTPSPARRAALGQVPRGPADLRRGVPARLNLLRALGVDR